MKDTSILLSISMLISGKEDMQKSLESLHYFKEAFPCEIILVDTGCSAGQRAMAEQYADKVLDFTWCNDFARARNVGLKEARGKWFLYLDDDEWFDDPQGIIRFFQSGEYKQYHSATYQVRNYFHRDGRIYEDAPVTRMVELEKNTIFVGRIHEYLQPFRFPTKHFADFVHHYGYAYRDEDAKRKHAERNIRPLLELVKEEPGEPRWVSQLVQEYFVIDDYEKAVDVCLSGLERLKKHKYVIDDWTKVGAVYGCLLMSLEALQRYEEEKHWIKTALAETQLPEATRAFFYFAGVRLYSKTKEYEKCRNHLEKYVALLKKLKDNREAVDTGTVLITTGAFQKCNFFPALLMGVESAIRMEDYGLAEEAFYLIDWADDRMLQQNAEEKKIVDACCSVEYHPLWVKLLQTLVGREDGMKEMYVVFLETEMVYKQQSETEKLSRLHRLVAELDYEHLYIAYTRILWAEERTDIKSEEQRKAEVYALFEQLFDRYPQEIIQIRAEVFRVAEHLEIDLEPLLLQVNFRVWRQSLDSWCMEAAPAQIQEWDARMAKWRKQEDIRYGIRVIKCLEGYLRNYRQALLSYDMLGQLLRTYADKVLAFFTPYYKENVFEELPEVLPDEVQLALEWKRLYQYQEEGEDRKALESVRKCLGIYPELDGAVAAYAEMFRDELKKRVSEAKEAQDELLKMAESLKTVAKLRMERGEYEAAKSILQQTQQYVPGDEEITALLQEIDEK